MKKIIKNSVFIGIASISLALNAAPIHKKQEDSKRFVGYFETWSDPWQSDGAKTQLANIPSYMNYVNLSFVKPDLNYVKGSYDLANTGIQFSYSSDALKDAMAALRKSHPGTKIILAVGGATYTNWAHYNLQAVQDLVSDFGFDGVDIDYEPEVPQCGLQKDDNQIHCATDKEFIEIVHATRQALPHPYLVTIAGWSIGAYGEGQWEQSKPQGDHTGQNIQLLRQAGGDIDMVNVMSYDASNDFDAKEALAAYRHFYSGAINMGVEVPVESWSGHVYKISEVEALTHAVISESEGSGKSPGMMLWSVQKTPSHPSVDFPSANMMAKSICEIFNLSDCDKPLT
jgi:chitinase